MAKGAGQEATSDLSCGCRSEVNTHGDSSAGAWTTSVLSFGCRSIVNTHSDS